jgi:hypothetical protein
MSEIELLSVKNYSAFLKIKYRWNHTKREVNLCVILLYNMSREIYKWGGAWSACAVVKQLWARLPYNNFKYFGIAP